MELAQREELKVSVRIYSFLTFFFKKGVKLEDHLAVKTSLLHDHCSIKGWQMLPPLELYATSCLHSR